MASEQSSAAQSAEDAENDATHRQVVAFRLGSENFGVDIGVVREIIRRQTVTQLPAAPESVEGVIDLRGVVIPVVDLCTRLDIGIAEETDDSRIIVLEVSGTTIGVFVDAVTEVLRVPASSIEPLSALGSRAGATFIDGIAKVEGGLLSLL